MKKAKAKSKETKKPIIEELEEDFETFPVSLYSAQSRADTIERILAELYAIGARENSSGETVVLRWESSMSKRDFLNLKEDLEWALKGLRSDAQGAFREAGDIERRLENATK